MGGVRTELHVSYPPRKQNVNDNTNTNHSFAFKNELRQLVKGHNKLKKPSITKTKGKTIHSLPCMQIKLTGKIHVKSLLDTGASRNFISKELYDKLNAVNKIRGIKKWTDIMLAANEEPLDIINECKIKIKISKYSWYEKFLVIKQNYYHMIMGDPFIRNKGLVIDLNDNSCYFKFAPSDQIKLCGDENWQKLAINNIHIGTPEMTSEIEELVKSYPNVFTDKIGEALDLQVELKLTDDKPICIRPYFLSPPTLNKMKAIVDDWLAQGIIEPSTSEYSSPAFLTAKDRLVVNYSALNKKLVKMNYPIGDLQNMYHHLSTRG